MLKHKQKHDESNITVTRIGWCSEHKRFCGQNHEDGMKLVENDLSGEDAE